MRWMNLEPIIQTEISQKEKDKYHIFTQGWQVEPRAPCLENIRTRHLIGAQ